MIRRGGRAAHEGPHSVTSGRVRSRPPRPQRLGSPEDSIQVSAAFQLPRRRCDRSPLSAAVPARAGDPKRCGSRTRARPTSMVRLADAQCRAPRMQVPQPSPNYAVAHEGSEWIAEGLQTVLTSILGPPKLRASRGASLDSAPLPRGGGRDESRDAERYGSCGLRCSHRHKHISDG